MRHAPIIAAIVLASASAAAQSNEDAIEKLKESGDTHMHDLHFREALVQYDAALKLGGGAAIQYNRARALQGLGDYPRALDALEEFVRTSTPELRAKVPLLEELIADLRGHVATLTITSNAAHATVRIGHELVGTTPIAVPVRVSTGRVLIEAEAQSFKPFTHEMTFAAGEQTVDLRLEKDAASVAVGPAPPISEHASPLRPVSIALGAAGLGGLALGAIFGGLAVAKRSDLDTLCPDKLCDAAGQQARSDAWTFSTVSTIGFVSGAILLAGGVVLYLVAPRAQKHVALSPFGVAGTF